MSKGVKVNIKTIKKNSNKIILSEYDLLIIPCHRKNPLLPIIFEEFKIKKNDIKKLIKKTHFEGEKNKTLLLTNVFNLNIIFVSCGDVINNSSLENAFIVAAKEALRMKYKNLLVFPHIDNLKIDNYESFIVRGLIWGIYKFDNFKTDKKSSITLNIAYEKSSLSKINYGLTQGKIIHKIANIANSPANYATPLYIAKYAQNLVKKGFEVNVLRKKELIKKKCGGILSVAEGSINEPNLVILKKIGKIDTSPIIIIGKTVTFDSGGISLKPNKNMGWMRYDKCGGMAVLGLMEILSNLNINRSVIGILGIAENMPGGNATKPGDIITSFNGKTIEILNTDAEGRLILADALGIASKYNPECIIDIATLTGAVISTLGNSAAGILGNNKNLINILQKCGEETGERLWELPIYKDFIDDMKSDFADLSNMSKSGNAGTATAAAFLSNFVPSNIPWAHIDIAGMAWQTNNSETQDSGATLFGIRLLLNWLSRNNVINN